MVDLERPKYCPYCGELLPKIQEKSSLEDSPYETCKSCGEIFIVITTRDFKKCIGDILPSKG